MTFKGRDFKRFFNVTHFYLDYYKCESQFLLRCKRIETVCARCDQFVFCSFHNFINFTIQAFQERMPMLWFNWIFKYTHPNTNTLYYSENFVTIFFINSYFLNDLFKLKLYNSFVNLIFFSLFIAFLYIQF